VKTRATDASGVTEGASRSPPEPAFDLSESKLHVPIARPGIVERPELLHRLLAASASPVIAVVAPPGYGKTTLLAQWAARTGPRVGWVSVDHRDNDPAVLLTYIAAALDRIEPIPPTVFRVLASSGAGIEVPRRLVAAMANSRPVALIIDHFEAVTNRDCFDAIAAIALGLPAGSQLAIGSRTVLPLPAARLRAQGGIAEIGVDDLAMSDETAAELLREAGVELAADDVRELVRCTEGWPAGLYLGALAVKAGGTRPEIGVKFTGDDRFMADYLRSELLDRVSPAYVSFLTRTSILERMCTPLCDATLGVTGSSELLDWIEAHNLLVIPLDRHQEWYRYHHLFRELLLSELRRREPDVVSELHLRAAEWYEANGMTEAAIDHAQAAGDADRVARLVLQIAYPVWASGRSDTLMGWMEWFETKQLIEQYPEIAAHGALMFATLGKPGTSARWTAAAERTTATRTFADGSTMEASLACLRALSCRDGPRAMRRDARLSWQELSPDSPHRPTMLHAEGLSHLLDGDAEGADAILARAVDDAIRIGSVPFVALVLSTRGIVADERGDWPAAERFAEQALELMNGGQFDEYWTSALVYAWTSFVAVRQGDLEQGRQLVTRASRLRSLLNYMLPVASVQALLEMARTYIALTDHGGARAVLTQAGDIFQQRPALGNLPQRADELRTKVDSIRAGALGASSLTTAELRLLPLLPTHLSFREIGDRLFVSRHTVKSQAISIYRKLGASSRSEAIDRMREFGLTEEV
jgi:LuxR family maltose regulon positive regulatory protein